MRGSGRPLRKISSKPSSLLVFLAFVALSATGIGCTPDVRMAAKRDLELVGSVALECGPEALAAVGKALDQGGATWLLDALSAGLCALRALIEHPHPLEGPELARAELVRQAVAGQEQHK